MGTYLATVPWTDQVGLATYLVLAWYANSVENKHRLTQCESNQHWLFCILFSYTKKSKSPFLQGQKTCTHYILPSVNSITKH